MILLLLVLKVLIIVVLFTASANLMQLIYSKIQWVMIVVNKMCSKEIYIKSELFDYYDNLIKQKNYKMKIL